jgi:hypothetical protein
MFEAEYYFNHRDIFEGNGISLLHRFKQVLNQDLPSRNPIEGIGFEGFAPQFNPTDTVAVFKVTYQAKSKAPVTLFVKEARKQHPTQRHIFQSSFDFISEQEFEDLKKSLQPTG